MDLTMLSADSDDHPPRPDLPVIRHLTYTEMHAMELGVAFAAFIFFGLAVGRTADVFAIVLVVARIIISDRRAKGDSTKCQHRLGFHDIRGEPWYFTNATLVTFGILVALYGGAL